MHLSRITAKVTVSTRGIGRQGLVATREFLMCIFHTQSRFYIATDN